MDGFGDDEMDGFGDDEMDGFGDDEMDGFGADEIERTGKMFLIGESCISLYCIISTVFGCWDNTDGDYYPFESKMHALAFMLKNGPRPMVINFFVFPHHYSTTVG